MKTFFAGAALACCFVAPVAYAKKPPQMSGLELQQMQARDIEGSKELVFGAVMSVLQDAGYRIQAADKDTGLITGLGSSTGKMTYNLWTGFGKSKKTPIVSAFIEQTSPAITRVRINFVMGKVKSTLYGSQPQDEEPILDAATYKDAFEKINQAVFLRASMTTSAPAPAQPAASPVTPAAPAAKPTTTSMVDKSLEINAR
ncbi:hypothetical protein VVT58_06510 [Sphingobium sp. SJ10-10]|uniref:hypothetical protein n=1 Tax=Sphingobium sp. SJ10-10 TaxID=3114999 RepID=UPI002E19CE17|nr:hypothetical protein [Sphingobium sp. SJ10-10]